ncbi:putative membrane protein, partial [Chlamydia psittaci 84-8471/1]
MAYLGWEISILMY